MSENFILIRKPIKNINMRINKEGKVQITANKKVSISVIESFVNSKKKWIERALNHQKLKEDFFSFNSNNYKNNDKFLFLGNKMTIFFIEDEKNYVSYDEENLYIYLKTDKIEDLTFRKKLIEKWFISESKMFLQNLGEKIYNQFFEPYKIDFPIFKFKYMKSRWGSCNFSKKIITINLNLMKFDIKCIEYIFVHEFSHFFHQDHSRKFYDFVYNLMPDYKIYEEKLKRFDI